MEEARQYPALTAEQRLFAWIYHGGSILLIVSLCAQAFLRIDALYPAILVLGSTRIALAAWQLARPEASQTPRTPIGLVITLAIWAATIALLIWIRFR